MKPLDAIDTVVGEATEGALEVHDLDEMSVRCGDDFIYAPTAADARAIALLRNIWPDVRDYIRVTSVLIPHTAQPGRGRLVEEMTSLDAALSKAIEGES